MLATPLLMTSVAQGALPPPTVEAGQVYKISKRNE